LFRSISERPLRRWCSLGFFHDYGAMSAVFGLLGHPPQDDLVPLDRMVEAHLVADVHQLAREGLLTVGTEARIEGGPGHGACRLAVHEPGILELDGQPIRLVPHCALPMHSFVCPGCGRDCYRLHRAAGIWRCRTCHRLDYASRHRHRSIPGFNRAIYLRRRLAHYGVSAELFSLIAPRPLSHRRFWRLALELRQLEERLLRHLREDVRIVLQRRDGRRRPHVDPS
jgi:hypothetical protein